MKSKGFTLVELLAVIVLLIIIFMVVYPAVNLVIKSGEDVTYQKQIDTILSATYDWSLKNTTMLPDKNETIYVTLAELKSDGLVKADIINPDTKEPFPDSLTISITNVGTNYKYTDENAKKAGDYLYKIGNVE